ncbi:MAG: hypothetical protein MUP85_09770, partial [Candidatus Lokiarchaeota archaeon]|nr:hypothetical protein [Candidatus Lokiarchaeota archaeon]
MNDAQEEMSYSKYYKTISSSEINVNRDQIFFREKYNEIINYLRVLLVKDEDELIKQYSHPRGALLLHITKGTDIFELFKFISTNYNLNIVQFNIDKILETPQEFYANFNLIMEEILRSNAEDTEKLSDKYDEVYKIKRILLVEQVIEFASQDKSLLRLFLNYFLKKSSDYSFIDQQTILFWINHNIDEINENSQEVFQFFDIFIKISQLTKEDRETIFSNISEKYPKIVFDIKTMVDLTKKWEIRDINHLIKIAIFKHYLNSELNDFSNEITHLLKDLIESGEFIPSISSNNQINPGNDSKSQNYETKNPEVLQKSIISDIQNQNISDFMLNQLYENAASERYTELLIILDKLN